MTPHGADDRTHWLGLLRNRVVANTSIYLAGSVVQQGSLAEMIERPAVPFVSEFVRAQRGHVLPGDRS